MTIRSGSSPTAWTTTTWKRCARRAGVAAAAASLAGLLAGAPSALAQGQSAALEYYVQPDYAGVNTLSVTTSGMRLENALAGTTLTFNTSGFFEREFVSQSPIDFTTTLDVTVPAFGGNIPSMETDLQVSGGTFRIDTPQGEVIEGELGDRGTLKLVPYPVAPRVFFYELTVAPLSTSVTPPQAATLSLQEIRTWGILITDGRSFPGAYGWGQNQQYFGQAEF